MGEDRGRNTAGDFKCWNCGLEEEQSGSLHGASHTSDAKLTPMGRHLAPPKLSPQPAWAEARVYVFFPESIWFEVFLGKSESNIS